jgi:hypothetical protein
LNFREIDFDLEKEQCRLAEQKKRGRGEGRRNTLPIIPAMCISSVGENVACNCLVFVDATTKSIFVSRLKTYTHFNKNDRANLLKKRVRTIPFSSSSRQGKSGDREMTVESYLIVFDRFFEGSQLSSPNSTKNFNRFFSKSFHLNYVETLSHNSVFVATAMCRSEIVCCSFFFLIPSF